MIHVVETRLGTQYLVTCDVTKEVLVKTYLEYTAIIVEEKYNKKENTDETKNGDWQYQRCNWKQESIAGDVEEGTRGL